MEYFEGFFNVLDGIVKSESISRELGEVEIVLRLLTGLRSGVVSRSEKIDLFLHLYKSSLITKGLECPDVLCIFELKRSKRRSEYASTENQSSQNVHDQWLIPTLFYSSIYNNKPEPSGHHNPETQPKRIVIHDAVKNDELQKSSKRAIHHDIHDSGGGDHGRDSNAHQ